MKQKVTSFHYNNLKIKLHPEVYHPAEDTFLLLETIDVTSKDFVFEIGTGSGVIALSCAQKGARVICSDINPYAVNLVQKNIDKNNSLPKGSIEIRKGSLFTVLNENEKFNLIIFNPPYLPTSKEEYIGGTGWFDKAVAGGTTGLQITTLFLNNLSTYLKDDGRAYTIFSTNSPRNQFNQILKNNQLESIILDSYSFTDETIEVHRITKK